MESSLVFFLAFESVTESQVGVYIFFVLEDRQLKTLNSFFVLTPDIKKNTSVVQDHRVGRVQVNGLFVVIQSLFKSSGAFHINAHVLKDAGLTQILVGGLYVVVVGLLTLAFLLKDNGEVHLGLVVVGFQFDDLNRR